MKKPVTRQRRRPAPLDRAQLAKTTGGDGWGTPTDPQAPDFGGNFGFQMTPRNLTDG